MRDYAKVAQENFNKGYNCSQSVLLAFGDKTGLDDKTALLLSSSFGGGMGRLREVCGAVSGMFMVIGLLYGYSAPADHAAKSAHYARLQTLAKRFSDETGSIICRDLLALGKGADNPVPEKRTEQYYKKRPCGELVYIAAKITQEYIESQLI